MRLSWHEIRTRASAFAKDWAGEGYEKGQTQLFYRDFFEIFGMSVRRLAAFEAPVQSLGKRRGYIDLFWKGVLLVEQKSKGRSLKRAKTQALDYFPHLKESDLPRYLLLSDFQGFKLYDLDEEFGISVSASSRSDLHHELHEALSMLWIEYGKESPDRLSPKARRLRTDLRKRLTAA